MVAALGAQEQITESIVKLAAARSNLEHNIVFDEHQDDVHVLTLLSDVLRGLQAVEVNQ